MADETPKFKAEAPVATPVAAPTPAAASGKAPTQVVAPKVVGGKAVYDIFADTEEVKEVDNSPKFKMLVNCGSFIKDQIVSSKEIEAAYPNADNWIKRGIVAKFRAPVIDD